MKVLFIGGTGRLSKDVVACALSRGHAVSLLTRGTASRRAFVPEGCEMLIGNVRDTETCSQLVRDRQFDVVIDFLSFTENQLLRTLDVFASHCSQFIFVSSATVYKKSDEEEVVSEEKTSVGNDAWEYAHNKCLCEQLLRDYCSKEGMPAYTIIRPYVTYGNTRVPYPIVPRGNVREWSLVARIKWGLPVPVFDGGLTKTTLTHTKDFAVGAVGLFGNSKAYGEAFHITGDEEVTWGSVLDAVGGSVGREVIRQNMSQEAIYGALPEYRPILLGDKGHTMRFDNSKIANMVPEFSAAISLREGVADMVSFYESHPELQLIDWRWMGRIDRLCLIKGGEIDAALYSFPDKKSKASYWCGRNDDIVAPVLSAAKQVKRGGGRLKSLIHK